jgi:uncharacterized protein GlcG (DUF336 family)
VLASARYERPGQSKRSESHTLAATARGKFLPQPGAVLIKDADGRILGAAGASGAAGEEDEAACAYGIEQAGFSADASA